VPPDSAVDSVAVILGRLKPAYRVLLELRFLRGYSLREVAAEMGKTVGSVKVMQLRALRQAASVIDAAELARMRRLHPRVEVLPA
jgi:RNA polymerase sigma factor (sigma-70 family)